jgi:hypothetical protein
MRGTSFTPSNGASGGILLATNDSMIQLQTPALSPHTIFAEVTDLRYNISWIITGVYGPRVDLEKKFLIRELRNLKDSIMENGF